MIVALHFDAPVDLDADESFVLCLAILVIGLSFKCIVRVNKYSRYGIVPALAVGPMLRIGVDKFARCGVVVVVIAAISDTRKPPRLQLQANLKDGGCCRGRVIPKLLYSP